MARATVLKRELDDEDGLVPEPDPEYDPVAHGFDDPNEDIEDADGDVEEGEVEEDDEDDPDFDFDDEDDFEDDERDDDDGLL